MTTTLKQWCEENHAAYILDSWDAEKNAPLTPESITYGSNASCWWICPSGHSYQMSAFKRKAGRGCPYCGGRKVFPGFNDLVTVSPELIPEWNWDRNGTLKPEQVIASSHRKVWWKCKNGHEWQSELNHRINGSGCPYCTGKKVLPGFNDLATTNPELLPEWSVKNTFGPDTVSAGSEKRVWWKCANGHEWKTAINKRTHGMGCPVCTNRVIIPGENDLASNLPDLAAEWDYEKNGSRRPDQISSQSNHKVWWRCEKGHSWKAMVTFRARGSGCPYCANRLVLPGFNDLATTDPAIAAQWAQDLNGQLTPEMVTKGTSRRVWWRCSDGHVWQTKVSLRTGSQRTGCPICAGNVSAKRIARARRVEEESRMQAGR